MKYFSILTCLFLVGCATTGPTIDKPIAEIPPSQLTAPPMPLIEIVASSDGTIDLNGALSTAIKNNGAARHNAEQLQQLEDWLKKTQDNIKKSNDKH